LRKTVEPDQHSERGLFTVVPGEARPIVRGVVLEMARKRLCGTEGIPPREQVLSEIKDDIEQLYDDGEG